MTTPATRARTGRQHQAATQRLARRAADDLQHTWKATPPDALATTFPTAVMPVFLASIATGQAAAAALAQPYVNDTVAEATDESPAATLAPAAFAGATAHGMSLEWLGMVLYAWLHEALARGLSTSEVHRRGLRRAIGYATTEINDAGRTAVQVAETAHPGIAGHERVVTLPACDRCIVLAGKLYRYSRGFERHPRCDCTMTPVTHASWAEQRQGNEPRAIFDRMSRAEQDRRFGPANAEAIRLGADLSQVVNARQGVATVQSFGRPLEVTNYGTSVRATFGGYDIQPDGRFRRRAANELHKQTGRRYRTAKAPRLTPNQIFRLGDEFGWSRPELQRQLRRFGYLIDP